MVLNEVREMPDKIKYEWANIFKVFWFDFESYLKVKKSIINLLMTKNIRVTIKN